MLVRSQDWPPHFTKLKRGFDKKGANAARNWTGELHANASTEQSRNLTSSTRHPQVVAGRVPWAYTSPQGRIIGKVFSAYPLSPSPCAISVRNDETPRPPAPSPKCPRGFCLEPCGSLLLVSNLATRNECAMSASLQTLRAHPSSAAATKIARTGPGVHLQGG
jgi:hypothetical protein